MNLWLSWANALTALRLLLAPVVTIAIVRSAWTLACIAFFVAVITDVMDGRIARKLNQATPQGGLFDHATDALFVTVTMAAVVSQGHAPWVLVVLIPTAFVQYTLDSQALRGQHLRTSMVGRLNGICYFIIPGTTVVVEAFGLHWFDYEWLVFLGWVLVATTLTSMSERAVAWARTRA